MGRFEKKKGHKASHRIALAAVIVLVLVVLVLFVMPQVLYRLRGEDAAPDKDGMVQSGDPSDTTGNTTEEFPEITPVEIQSPVTFPLDVEEGKLRIENVVPFDGWNPDCADQVDTNIAAIVVTNLSATYLARGEFTIATDDGRTLHFQITDLPAGASVMAFDTDNATVGMNTVYGMPICQAQFEEATSLMEEKITVSVTGSHITLKNNTDEDIADVVVYCHGLLGDQYFGGITYTYTVNTLTAGGTAELDAEDCALGMVEVVRVEANEP